MDQATSSVTPQEEITFGEFLETLRRRRLGIGAFIAGATLLAAVASFVLPKHYTAEVLLSAVTITPGETQTMGSSIGSALTQLSGLSSLASLMPADQRKAESVAVLQSDGLTEQYLRDNDLLPVLYASTWDARARRWKVTDPDKVPTLWKANQYFKKKIRLVTVDARTGLVTLDITWKDSQTAARWANGLVKLTNEYLRKKAIDETDRNIAYLTAQAAATDAVGIKQAVYVLLQSEIEKAMLARGTEQYAFKVLDPAEAPEKPSFPLPTLFILGALFGSSALACAAVFIHMAWSNR